MYPNPDQGGLIVWKRAVHTLLGPLAYAYVLSRVRRDGELAFPSGAPISHGSGPDPDRILIFGGLIVRGLGVASYDLALSGHLARKIAARTGRGADVETRGYDRFDARMALDVLRSENVDRFDLVLFMLGITDIVSLRPLAEYRRDIRKLMGEIARISTPSRPVLIAGVAPFMQDMDVPRFVIAWMERRTLRQNEVTRLACAEFGVAQYVPFAPERAGIRYGRDASIVYESWATALVPSVTVALASKSDAPDPAGDESARLRALEDLAIDPAPDAAVDRIVEMARDMLGGEVASLNVIDRDRQWSKAAAGWNPRDIPRAQAICNTTIQTPGAHVIEDLDQDPAYAGSPLLEGPDHMRFYAGYPLEAPGGERVGALCVMNRRPRAFTAGETATLRDLALRAQEILWEQRS